MKNSERVREFHEVMGAPVRRRPDLATAEERELRKRLITEERDELFEALDAEDVIGVADALADLLYVTYGTAVQFGIPIEAVFREVHRSNITKRGGTKDEGGKFLKPSWYQPPDIWSILKSRLR